MSDKDKPALGWKWRIGKTRYDVKIERLQSRLKAAEAVMTAVRREQSKFHREWANVEAALDAYDAVAGRGEEEK